MQHANPLATETSPTGWHPNRMLRKAKKKEKRHENQLERTRIREDLNAGLRDPEIFLDFAVQRKNTKKLLRSGSDDRRWLLYVQKRKVKSELVNIRDLDTFIQKTSRSKTLYALIAMGFFRHVLKSEEYREDHRYKLAIRRALEEPGLNKSIQRKWYNFDREFPGGLQKQPW